MPTASAVVASTAAIWLRWHHRRHAHSSAGDGDGTSVCKGQRHGNGGGGGGIGGTYGGDGDRDSTSGGGGAGDGDRGDGEDSDEGATAAMETVIALLAPAGIVMAEVVAATLAALVAGAVKVDGESGRFVGDVGEGDGGKGAGVSGITVYQASGPPPRFSPRRHGRNERATSKAKGAQRKKNSGLDARESRN